MEFLIQPFV